MGRPWTCIRPTRFWFQKPIYGLPSTLHVIRKCQAKNKSWTLPDIPPKSCDLIWEFKKWKKRNWTFLSSCMVHLPALKYIYSFWRVFFFGRGVISGCTEKLLPDCTQGLASRGVQEAMQCQGLNPNAPQPTELLLQSQIMKFK